LIHLLVTAPVTIAIVVFAIANRQDVIVWPLPDTVPVPLAIVVVISLVIGFIVGELAAWIGGRRWRREARHKAKRIAALEQELAAAQARLRPEAAPGGTLSPPVSQADH
jgi:uncharacterized integral membrane protein